MIGGGGNLRRIDLLLCRGVVEKCVVGKPVNPKCGLLVECVGNTHFRHDSAYFNKNRSTVRVLAVLGR